MTFNTEVGGASATSYVSVASADDYMTVREDSTPWDDLLYNSTGTVTATSRKQSLLIQATREIDRTFRFFGSRDGNDLKESEDYQNLEFPRASDTDADGNLLIPDEVQYATCEQALWILQRNAVQTAQGENVVKLPKFSEQAYDYIKPWVTRAVMRIGRSPWQGSKY
jgi:hypothetical protein